MLYLPIVNLYTPEFSHIVCILSKYSCNLPYLPKVSQYLQMALMLSIYRPKTVYFHVYYPTDTALPVVNKTYTNAHIASIPHI